MIQLPVFAPNILQVTRPEIPKAARPFFACAHIEIFPARAREIDDSAPETSYRSRTRMLDIQAYDHIRAFTGIQAAVGQLSDLGYLLK